MGLYGGGGVGKKNIYGMVVREIFHSAPCQDPKINEIALLQNKYFCRSVTPSTKF